MGFSSSHAAILSLLFVTLSTLQPQKSPDFISKRTLPDGELERRIFRNGISALETSVRGPGTLRLWQASDGKRFVQMILDPKGAIVDCEFSRDAENVERFLEGFEEASIRARVLSEDGYVSQSGPGVNETLVLTGGSQSEDVAHILDLRRLRKECRETHDRIRNEIAKKEGFEKEDKRKKRDIFIYPGTNWCGIGSSTDRYNELGFSAAADRCCRQHDYCSHTIEGFTSKYNLFNYRLHTISHCDCDERFRTCLKMVNNAASNMVGKLFFNVVQMRCFVLKAEKACARRSWWGKCVKYEMQKTAHLRDALAF